jgi:hypothetical protein
MNYADEAKQHANVMNVRKGILGIIQEVDAEYENSTFGKIEKGVRKMEEVVYRVLRAIKLNDPVLRTIIGAVAGVIYLLVQIVYAIHKVAIKRRRSRVARGLPVRPLKVSTEVV